MTKTDLVSFTGIYAVSVTDPSAGSGVQQLLIKDTGGTLTLGQTTGLTFVSGANNSMQMVVQGTLANLNAALATLTYTLTGKSLGAGGAAAIVGTSSTTSNTTTGLTTSSIPPDSEVYAHEIPGE